MPHAAEVRLPLHLHQVLDGDAAPAVRNSGEC